MLFAASASARPESSPGKGHPATTDSKPVTFHVHRNHVLIRSAYALERWEVGPKRRDIRAAQVHKRAIRIDSVREQLADFRDRRRRLLDQYRASQEALSDLDPPGKAYLDGLAQCESGGDPQAVDPSGTYYGLFQFDYGTWASVGGSGSPAAAAAGEQYFRAAVLWRQRGSAPWPVCG